MLVSWRTDRWWHRRAAGWARRLAAVALAVSALGVAVPVSGSPTRPTCVDAAAVHHASLVVEHGNGGVLRFCVGFDQDRISGEQLLDLSGVRYSTLSFGSLGKAVCQIDGEPASYPPTCWSSTSPYWAMFVSRGGGAWSSSAAGIAGQTFADGDAEGFRYNPQTGGGGGTPASPAGICVPSTTPTAGAAVTSAAAAPANPAGPSHISSPAAAAPTGPGPAALTAPGSPASTPSASASRSADASTVAASGGGRGSGADEARVSPGLVTASLAFGGLIGLAGIQLLHRRRPRRR